MARILIAEDEASLREFVSRALSTVGHEVRAVNDGGQALVALEEDSFDLLLADVRMPVMDGLALALKVSLDFPGMPILLMTGYAQEKQRAYNLDHLIRDVVAKPFTIEQICEAVERALEPVATAN